jgi:DNA invertase Pin-like site-specific DNA recombinase
MTEDRQRRIALYARVSTDPQEASLEGQFRELREHTARQGLEVVEEVRDLAEKRHTLERPGVERLRHLAESGAVEEVWAWEWSRYGAFPMPEVLAVELRDAGVELRSLDDGGGGEDGEDMQVIRSLFARREQRDRVRRSNRGRRDKTLRGEVFGGFRARYGLRFVKGRNKAGREVSVGYEVDPERMAIVRRVFEAITDGGSLRGVRRELEQEGVPNPSGGPRWSTTTLKGIVQDDVFRPLSVEEIGPLLPSKAAERLLPGRVYGIHWSVRKRSKFKSARGKARTVYETPPEEWVAIPVDLAGSGLDRATVDRARALVAQNHASASVGDRVWELSGGFLKCGECGRNMIGYRRANKSGYNHYYRCRPSSTLDACPNRKSHPALDLEDQAASMFEWEASYETMVELYDRAVEEQFGGRSHRAAERRTALAGRLAELEAERKAYLRQNARGVLSDAELDQMLREVEEQSAGFAEELRVVDDEAETARRLETARYSLIHAEWYEDPDAVWPRELLTSGSSPEQVRAAYARFGARFTVDAAGDLTMRLELPLEGGSLHLTTTS